MNKKIILSITLVSILACNTVSASWSIKSLGTLGGAYSGASDINDSGQVVGHYEYYPYFKGFITGIDGEGMMNFANKWNYITNINNSGQVTGIYDFNDDLNYHAFITGPNGVGVTDLGTLGGTGSYGHGINNSGQVVGNSFTAGDKYIHAFMTGPNGVGMTDLGILDGNNRSAAIGINDSGQVVGGYFNSNDGPGHAFITGPNGVGMRNLGTLAGDDSSSPAGINNSGQVAGYSYNANGSYPDGPYHAFITGPNGIGMTSLGAMGGDWSYASGINNLGQVVGVAGYNPYASHANSFIYSDGVMVNLSYLDAVIQAGWTGLYASAINDNGQIVGSGILNGVVQAFLLSGADDEDFYRSYVPFPIPLSPPPVPEPSTYAMLLAGLGLLFFRTKTELNS